MDSPARRRPLRAREAELNLAREAIRAGLAGPGRLLLVCAEAGLGRTALVEELLDGLQVPALRLTAPWTSASGPGPGDALERGIRVVAVDDAHRAGTPTLAYLRETLLLVVERAAVLLLTCTHRPPGDPIEELAALAASREALTRLDLEPLPVAAMAELAEQMLGRPLHLDEAARLGEVGGNPALLEDLTREFRVRDAPRHRSPPWRPRMPQLVDLTPQTVELLRHIAVLDPEVTCDDLCLISGHQPDIVAPALAAGLRAGLLHTNEDRSVTHVYARIRQALAAQVPEPIRDDLCRRVAHRLVARGGTPARAARLLSGTVLRDDDLGTVAALAAQLAAAGLPGAVPLWDSAVRGPGLGRPARGVARAALTWALLHAGQSARAQRCAEESLAELVSSPCPAVGPRVEEARCAVVLALLAQGRWVRAYEVCQARLDGRRATTGDLALLAVTAALAGRAAESRVATAGIRLAPVTPDEPEWVREAVAVAEGAAALQRGRFADAEAALRTPPGRAPGDPAESAFRALRAVLFGHTLELLDRPGQAAAAWQAAGTGASAALAAAAPAYLGIEVLPLARARTLVAAFAKAAGTAEAAPWTAAADALAAQVAGHDGPGASARLPLDRTPERGYASAWATRALLATQRGQHTATELLDWVWPSWLHGTAADRATLAVDVAELCARGGDSRRGARVVADLRALADANEGIGLVEVLARAAAGLVAGAGDQVVASVAALAPHRLGLRSRLLEAGAEALRRQGRSEDAAAAAAGAAEGFATLGWTLDADRVRAGFEVREGPRAPAPRREVSGWDSLTQAERVVAAHVEQGMSNARIAAALVVSRRTVETHVSHILAKLGLRSRNELIIAANRAFARNDPPAPPGNLHEPPRT